MSAAALAGLEAEVRQLQSTVAYLERWSWNNWFAAQTALESARAAREEAAAARRTAEEAMAGQRPASEPAGDDGRTTRGTGRGGRKRKRSKTAAARGT